MGGPMLLLNSLLAGRSCVIKRFVLPGVLLRNFSLEGSLSHPPNLKRPRMDTAPFTGSFITLFPQGNSLRLHIQFSKQTRDYSLLQIKCWLCVLTGFYITDIICVRLISVPVHRKASAYFPDMRTNQLKLQMYCSDKSLYCKELITTLHYYLNDPTKNLPIGLK